MAASGSEYLTVCGVRIPADFTVDCRWVTSNLAIGGIIGTTANMAWLRANGVTHVVDLEEEFDDRALGTRVGVAVLWLPVSAAMRAIDAETARAAVAYAEQALRDPAHRLYVHCLAGLDRAPLGGYAILRSQGCTPTEAIGLLRAAQPAAALAPDGLAIIENALSGHDGAAASPCAPSRQEGRAK